MNSIHKTISLIAVSISLTACAGKVPSNLGIQNSTLSECSSKPNCVSSFATTKGHKIASFELAMPAEKAWPLINKTIGDNKVTKMVSSTGNYLHAEYKSKTMGFIDDVELLVSSDQKRVDVRSASRVGYSDRGVNRKRIEALRSELAGLGVIK